MDDSTGAVRRLWDAGVPIAREAADMPWDERLAYVLDPDGNPVALAQAARDA